MDYLLYVDDCLIIAMVQVFLDLKCSRISWMLIMYFDFIPCYLFKVSHRVIIGYRLRFSKVIEYLTRDLSLPLKGKYTYSFLSGSLLGNLWP